MATLEVHDGKGGVEYVNIERGVVALFGSDPKCEVQVKDPQALPIHARMMWRKGRYKLEATLESRSIRVNGRKVVSTTFRQGDELEIGAFRVFLLKADDGEGEKEGEAAGERAQQPPRRQQEKKPEAVERLESESLDWLKAAERSERSRKTDQDRRRAREPGGNWLSRIGKLLSGTGEEPGDERVATSPVVLGLIGTLVMLVAFSVGLWKVIRWRVEDNQFRRAVDTLAEGDARNALRMFDRFLEMAPGDSRASKARVLRALANVRQHTGGAGPALGEALKAAQAMSREAQNEPAFEDSRMELGEEILKIAAGFCQAAAATGRREALAQAEEALALQGAVAGMAAGAQRSRTRLNVLLPSAQAAVRKAEVRRDALARMDQALSQGDASALFQSRDELVALYPDQAADQDVVERLKKACELLRAGVTFEESRQQGIAGPRQEALGEMTTLVRRFGVGGDIGGGAQAGSLVFALVDGIAYGLDGRDGRPIWQRLVGQSSAFRPFPVPGDEAQVLGVDARTDELLCLESLTGTVRWRQALGERAVDRPLVLGQQVYQPLPSGSILRLDLTSGERTGILRLGRPIAGSPVSDGTGQFLYQAAGGSNLFVLDREKMECVEVVYSGHAEGALACAPVRVGRYLVLVENHAPEAGRWRILRSGEDGRGLGSAQTVDVPGWTWEPPPAQRAVIYSASDHGAVSAYAIGAEAERSPFQPIARILPDTARTGPAFALARSENELWLGSGGRSSRLDLDPERGVIEPSWTWADSGPVLATVQAVGGKTAVFTVKAEGSEGTALVGLDAASGKVLWRTELGSAWGASPRAIGQGSALEALSGKGERVLLSGPKLQAGGFQEEPLEGKAARGAWPGGLSWVGEGPPEVFWKAGNPGGSVYTASPSGGLSVMGLPVEVVEKPAVLEERLLCAGRDGSAHLVPLRKSDGGRVSPFFPALDRNRPYRWLAPVVLAENRACLADRSGRLRLVGLEVGSEGKGRKLGTISEELDLGESIEGAAGTAEVVMVGLEGGRLRAFSARDLSPIGSWNLDAPRVFGPVRAGDWVFAGDAKGSVMAFSADGQRRWTVKLSGGITAGAPVIREELAWFLSRDGILESVGLERGELSDTIDLGCLPAGGALVVEGRLVIPVGPGSLAVWDEPQ